MQLINYAKITNELAVWNDYLERAERLMETTEVDITDPATVYLLEVGVVISPQLPATLAYRDRIGTLWQPLIGRAKAIKDENAATLIGNKIDAIQNAIENPARYTRTNLQQYYDNHPEDTLRMLLTDPNLQLKDVENLLHLTGHGLKKVRKEYGLEKEKEKMLRHRELTEAEIAKLQELYAIDKLAAMWLGINYYGQGEKRLGRIFGVTHVAIKYNLHTYDLRNTRPASIPEPDQEGNYNLDAIITSIQEENRQTRELTQQKNERQIEERQIREQQETARITQERLKIIEFYNQYGEQKTIEQFGVNRNKIMRWRKLLNLRPRRQN